MDSLIEQVSQAESKNRSPFKRRAGLTDEEMGMRPHYSFLASHKLSVTGFHTGQLSWCMSFYTCTDNLTVKRIALLLLWDSWRNYLHELIVSTSLSLGRGLIVEAT